MGPKAVGAVERIRSENEDLRGQVSFQEKKIKDLEAGVTKEMVTLKQEN
jgi:hypothetical protein